MISFSSYAKLFQVNFVVLRISLFVSEGNDGILMFSSNAIKINGFRHLTSFSINNLNYLLLANETNIYFP
jgi:hypothetical protein